jgi:hypothetical protein
MLMTKPHLTDLQKSAILDKWGTSPLSLQDFCQQENISISSFHRWRQQLTVPPESKGGGTDWIELEPSKQGVRPALPDSSSDWNVELVLPGDITLRVRY